ncbi:MAG: tetratricopeptide repeat protein, partial [Candidatus Rokubacteria bacterium]|nr:tetratricopeptide repeat protein [Candidatus Rokubacteria bacterium]
MNWDDGATFLDNPHYRGLGWTQVRWMFTTFHMNHYIPLTWLTLGADYVLWGMNPAGYHLTSLVLHVGAALVFYAVAVRLLGLALPGADGRIDRGLRPAAAFAALVFAVHPLRVESVAWVTERRDVLSGLLFLLTILAYLRAYAAGGDRAARRRWLAASVGVFGLALLSKAIVMTLPLVLVALDASPLRHLSLRDRRIWVEKIPFVFLAAVGAVVALVAVQRETVLAPLADHGIAARVAVAGYGVVFYLWKTLAPVGLSPFYPLPAPLDPLAPRFILAAAGVVGITGGVLVARRRFPAAAVAWAAYVAMLLPVLGLAQQGEQIVADRYSYLSCLGWAALAGAGLLTVWRAGERRTPARPVPTAAILAAVVIVAALGTLTWRQVLIWRDSVSLWTRAVQVTPDAYVAHYNLGNALLREQRFAEAIARYRRSLEIEPVQPLAYFNLGNALASQGNVNEAIEHYRVSLTIDPAQAAAHYRLGNLLLRQREHEAAADHFRRALGIRPTFAEAHNNLGVALAEQGRPADAIASYREALRLQPTNANAHNNLGNALLTQGRVG